VKGSLSLQRDKGGGAFVIQSGSFLAGRLVGPFKLVSVAQTYHYTHEEMLQASATWSNFYEREQPQERPSIGHTISLLGKTSLDSPLIGLVLVLSNSRV
jgi:hypothetical protein